MKNLNKISILVLLLITAGCFAGGRAGRGTIEDIYQRSYDGLLGVKKNGGDWANPDACDKSDRIVMTRDNQSRSEFYAALLASKMSNSEIDAWLSGCVDWGGITYPSIHGLYTY